MLAADLLEQQIQVQAHTIDLLCQQIALMELDHTRFVRNMVSEFLVVQESGIDIRDLLIAGLQDMDDEIARREEHVL